MKKVIILSCLAFITLSALGLNAYLNGAKKTNALTTESTPMEEAIEKTERPEIELKEPEKKNVEIATQTKTVEEKKEIKKLAPKSEKKVDPPIVDKKQIEKKVVENDIPPVREVLESDTDDSAIAVVADIAKLEVIEEVPELAIEHFGRASLKQPREKQIKKKAKLTAKVSKKEQRKKRKKIRK